MKTKVFTLLALACIGATACVDEIGNTGLRYTFEAGREHFEVPSKTTISAGNKTLWVAEDEVAVYADGGPAIKCTAATAGENSGFNSDVQLNGSSFLMTYPYESALGIDNDNVKFRIPQSQVPTLNSFDPKAAVSVAATSDLAAKVMFKNALSLLKFTIPSYLDGKVIKINIESKNGVAIAGDVLCNPITLANEMVEEGQSHTSVYIESETGLQAGVYYIAVRPCTIEEGIKVTATLADSKTYVRESNATTFSVNYIYNFGSVADALDIPRDWYISPGGDAQADGSSWQTATTLDNALSHAVDGATLHLAAGVYKPTVALPYMEGDVAAAASDAHKSFAITKNINIYGGYPSNPTTGAVADPSANKTILDGGGVSYHTLVIGAPKSEKQKVVINGVNITGGNNKEASSNNIVTYNGITLEATAGAGLAIVGSNISLNQVNISENISNTASLYCTASEITMTSCSSTDNSGSNNGTGIYLTGTLANISNSSFDRNVGAMGAASLILNSTALFTGCTFKDNRNSNNGIIYAYNSGSSDVEVIFDRCTISGNKCVEGASSGLIGGLYCYNYSTGTHKTYILNSVFVDNYANGRGGGMYIRNNQSQDMYLYCVNSTFARNSAGSTGSAITLYGAATKKIIANIISCTVTGNISRGTTNIGAFTCETEGNTFNFYNTIAVGNNTTGGDACDVYLKNTAAVASYKSSFIGSKYYNADGVASDSTFDYTTMLAAPANGIVKLVGTASTNPAFGNGMTATALKALAAGSMTAEILGKDQAGNSRTGTIAGAYVGSATQQ